MSLRIAFAEIVSIFFMVIILGSLRSKAEKDEKGQRVFFYFTLCTTFGLLFDALSYIADEHQMNAVILTIVNIMAFSLILVCTSLFSVYMITVIRWTREISFKPIYPILIYSCLNIIWIIVGACNGKFFTVVDNHLVYGPWCDIIMIMPIFGVVFVLFLLFFFAKSLGRRMTFVLGSFVFFPLNAAVILLFSDELQLAYLGTALSCATIYTFVRREEINDVCLREQILSEISSTDTLTGLLNRRGFNDALGQAANHKNLGIVFCDLNALKYRNDNFGHSAGDAYIQKFADILRKVFRDCGSICRISGDEFAVLLFDISEEEFDEFKERLRLAISRNDRIASVGHAYGNAYPPMELFCIAEKEMYDDKNRYYKETGLDRRKSV